MKTEIGQLTLRLPSAFEDRAHAISRLLGEALVRQQGLPGGQITHIDVGPVPVDLCHSDRAIAESIANSIVQSIREI